VLHLVIKVLFSHFIIFDMCFDSELTGKGTKRGREEDVGNPSRPGSREGWEGVHNGEKSP